jgi:hypothetical protein
MALEISGVHLGFHSALATSDSDKVFWGTDAAFQYGNTTILGSTSGVFDTGSTLLGLETGKLLRYS